MYRFDDRDLYEELISNKKVNEAPAMKAADKFFLKCAKIYKCKFLTNDKCKDYWDEFGKEWILENRITFMFIEGTLIIE